MQKRELWRYYVLCVELKSFNIIAIFTKEKEDGVLDVDQIFHWNE